jgi:CTP:molybdopterin cytidylyltransferase MocA
MLSSIQTGIQFIAAHSESERTREEPDSLARCDAFFLALVDHPFVQASTLQQLIRSRHGTKADVLRPTYRGKHGHPILISARCIETILALHDDQTLNDFVRAKSTIAVDVPVEDAATIQDIDTPADYDAAINRRDRDSSAD